MLLGIWWRIIDTKRFAKAATVVRAKHITKATFMLEVTASAEQIPRICSATGLLVTMGSNRVSLTFDII
jgi:hypothetical protein